MNTVNKLINKRKERKIMDREERIMNRLQEHYDYIEDKCRSNGTPYEVVALCSFKEVKIMDWMFIQTII